MTIWPTTMLSPARVGILFMAEVIVGVGSAATLTDEPFGLREALGTVLIVCAGIAEVWRRPDVSTPANASHPLQQWLPRRDSRRLPPGERS